MLVLSRKQHDAIFIGENIKITVVRIDRNQVRLGIEAPSHIPVLREELQLDAEEREARTAWHADERIGELA